MLVAWSPSWAEQKRRPEYTRMQVGTQSDIPLDVARMKNNNQTKTKPLKYKLHQQNIT